MTDGVSKGEDIYKLARDREKQAARLSDMEIWRKVVLNAVTMDAPIQMKASILLQAISDIGIVFELLKQYNEQKILSDKQYHDLLKLCIAELEEKQGMVDFDPLNYEDF